VLSMSPAPETMVLSLDCSDRRVSLHTSAYEVAQVSVGCRISVGWVGECKKLKNLDHGSQLVYIPSSSETSLTK